MLYYIIMLPLEYFIPHDKIFAKQQTAKRGNTHRKQFTYLVRVMGKSVEACGISSVMSVWISDSVCMCRWKRMGERASESAGWIRQPFLSTGEPGCTSVPHLPWWWLVANAAENFEKRSISNPCDHHFLLFLFCVAHACMRFLQLLHFPTYSPKTSTSHWLETWNCLQVWVSVADPP